MFDLDPHQKKVDLTYHNVSKMVPASNRKRRRKRRRRKRKRRRRRRRKRRERRRREEKKKKEKEEEKEDEEEGEKEEEEKEEEEKEEEEKEEEEKEEEKEEACVQKRPTSVSIDFPLPPFFTLFFLPPTPPSSLPSTFPLPSSLFPLLPILTWLCCTQTQCAGSLQFRPPS